MGSPAGHSGRQSHRDPRTRSGPRRGRPLCLPTATRRSHLYSPITCRTVNPLLVYRLSVPRRSALDRRALWYSAAFVALAALVDITDFDRVNAFAKRNLQPLAGGNGHPRMRAWTEV